MPIIRIENYPLAQEGGESHLERVAQSLRRACVFADVYGIDSVSKVTVVLGSKQLIKSDKTLILFVEGLIDHSLRTELARDRLARILGEEVFRHLSPDWKVEVFITRFNPARESYFTTGDKEFTSTQ